MHGKGREMYTEFISENMQGKDRSEALGVDGNVFNMGLEE
jgi:hypothetical protein